MSPTDLLGSDVHVERAELGSEDACALIDALNEELLARYPEPGATYFRLDAAEVAEGSGAFLIARVAEAAVGCGAIRKIDDDIVELKRMYVAPVARGRGVGGALLRALLDAAHQMNARRVVLETGTRQAEAIRLYARAGFVEIPAYGEYVGAPLSVCYGLRL